MSRPMLKLFVVLAIAVSTAAVAFAQRQPAAERGAGERGAAGAGAGAAADGQGSHRATFEVYKDNSGDYRWRLRATNSQILAIAARGYSDKRSAMSAIESIKRAAAEAPVEEKEQAAGSGAQGKDDPAKASGAGAGANTPAKKAEK